MLVGCELVGCVVERRGVVVVGGGVAVWVVAVCVFDDGDNGECDVSVRRLSMRW